MQWKWNFFESRTKRDEVKTDLRFSSSVSAMKKYLRCPSSGIIQNSLGRQSSTVSFIEQVSRFNFTGSLEACKNKYDEN